MEYSRDTVYKPSPETVAKSNLESLRKFMGKNSIQELYDYADAHMGEFYERLVGHLGIDFFENFTRITDTGKGKENTTWYIGGKINIAYNCVERHKNDQTLAMKWEDEHGTIGSMTYSDMDQKVGKFAGSLTDLGIKNGDRVGIYMPMIPEAIIGMYAIMRINAIAVPMFSGYGKESVEIRIKDSGIKYVMTVESYKRKGKEIPMASLIRDINGINLITLGNDIGNDMDFRKLMADGKYTHSVKSSSEDPAIMLYTSGTTGKPKGTVHVHGGSFINIVKEVHYYTDFKKSDTIFWITDLGWMMGPWEIMGAHSIGGSLFLYSGAVDFPNDERVWDMVERNGITILGLSPTFVRTMKAHGIRRPFKGIKAFASTGEPWDPESWLYLFNVLGEGKIPICNVSGGTDIIGCFLASTPVTPLKVACLYRGLGMGITVKDNDGNDIYDQVGYLCAKEHLPSMTRGIWGDHEKYISTYWSRFPGTWFHGDWALMDRDGYFYLYGRSDDVIKTAGKRIGPAEVEGVADRVEGVIESAAIGIPDQVKGEVIVVFYTGIEGIETQIRKEVENSIGKSFSPKHVIHIGTLPKTRNGKIMRRIVKSAFMGENPGDITGLDDPGIIELIRVMGEKARQNLPSGNS